MSDAPRYLVESSADTQAEYE